MYLCASIGIPSRTVRGATFEERRCTRRSSFQCHSRSLGKHPATSESGDVVFLNAWTTMRMHSKKKIKLNTSNGLSLGPFQDLDGSATFEERRWTRRSSLPIYQGPFQLNGGTPVSVDVQIFLVYTLIVLIMDNTSDFSHVARFTAIAANVKHSVCYVALLYT